MFYYWRPMQARQRAASSRLLLYQFCPSVRQHLSLARFRPGCLCVCSPRRSTQRALRGHWACLYAAPRPCSRSVGLAPCRMAAKRVFDQSRRCRAAATRPAHLCPIYGDRYTTACKQRTSTARRLVENMMFIKIFLEIKESAAAPCYPSVLSLSAPSQ